MPADTLVIHGEQDDVVPLAASFDWARPQALPVTVLPGVLIYALGFTFIVVPITAPVLLIMGVDPIWLGVLFVLSVYHFPSGIVGRLRVMALHKPRADEEPR